MNPRKNKFMERIITICILVIWFHSNILSQDNPPNIIFFLVDDQGWTGTSVQMDENRSDSKSDFYVTPHLEQLASQGMRFSKAYSPSPICGASRASIMMGQSTAKTRLTLNPEAVTPSSAYLLDPPRALEIDTTEDTYAEILKRLGYRTGHIAKWHMYGGGPANNGFDAEIAGGPPNQGDMIVENPKSIYRITDRTMDFIAEAVADTVPFFFQIGHHAVHLDIQCTQEMYDLYNDSSQRPLGVNHRDKGYGAMTEDLDRSLGQIMHLLDSLEITDNTYLVYFSDNGAVRKVGNVLLSPNTPLKEGKLTCWDGGHRVPMIVRGPGINPGSHCHFPVIGYDLYPTFIDMAISKDTSLMDSVLVPEYVEGGSLFPTLTNGGQLTADREDQAIYFHMPHNFIPTSSHYTMMIEYPYKLINFFETGEKLLFNLNNDIDESNPLDRWNIMSPMLVKMRNHLLEVDAQFPKPDPVHPDFSGMGEDLDMDDLPDEWEMIMLLTVEYNADDDPDNDGASNYEEYLNDTDPYVYDPIYDANTIQSVFGFDAFPNPAGDLLYIENDSAVLKEISLDIFDIVGRKVFSYDGMIDRVHELNISNFSPGTYILKIKEGDMEGLHKFVVTQ